MLPSDLDRLGPAALWGALDAETRQLAAESLYADPSGRREGDLAVAATLRFRETTVRKLPQQQRIGYLLRAVRVDDALASSLLVALHLGRRRPILSAFLERLGIPQKDGVIDSEHDLQPPAEDRLAAAVEDLFGAFPAAEVELYVTTLVALDRAAWGGLAAVLRGRSASRTA